MHTTVAQAIRQYLASQVQSERQTRRFFRLDGFDERTYVKLLQLLNGSNNTIEGQPIWIRTTKPIEGYEQYALEVGKSSTWYRNNLPSGYALILVFNSYTTDAQSLKDIFPITENTVATAGLTDLIDAAAAQSEYQLDYEQLTQVTEFIRRLRKNLFSPQLRDLTEFLISVSNRLARDAGTRIDSAIAMSLPYLGLFCTSELTKIFNTSRGDRLLRDNYRAALLGSQLLDDKELQRYMAPLNEADFDDDSAHGGLSTTQKHEYVERFLRDVISDRGLLLEILSIDWREISPILHKRTKKTKEEKRQELAQALTDALEEQQVEISRLSESTQDALQDIQDGREPRDVDIENLIEELGDDLPKAVRNEIKRLRGAAKLQTHDFVGGLVSITVDLVQSVEVEDDAEDYSVVVSSSVDTDERVSSKRAEALAVFASLYGGLYHWITSIQWEFDSFWEYVETHAQLIGDDEEEEGQREKVIKDSIDFKVSLRDADGAIIAVGDLTWLYRSDSPDALTALHIWTLAQSPQPLHIPIYNSTVDSNDIGDLDLSRPIISFGTWYRSSTNLYDVVSTVLKPRVNSNEWAEISNAFVEIESSWNKLIEISASHGLYSAPIPEFLETYEKWLSEIIGVLKHSETAAYGFRELVRAWIVGRETFDDWVVVPLLHPIKLQWWIARAVQFNKFINTMVLSIKSGSIVDEKRFKHELEVTFSSSHSPSMLALPAQDQRVNYFLPVNELQGYELYRRQDQASVAHGLDPDLVTDVEGEQAVQTAARDIARTIQSYVETYPFVRDGLEIYVVQCRNGSLPGSLVERLDQISRRRGWHLRINLIVHTTDRGAPLFQRISEWIRSNEQFAEKLPGRYFPQVTMKVLECSFDELFEQVGDTDLVILADVLAERGQSVRARLVQPDATKALPAWEYIPFTRNVMRPFERRERLREIDLYPADQPALFRYFYNLQWAAYERRAAPVDEVVQFYLEISLTDWEHDLNRLHQQFNWVVCYDPTVDRFLLQATCEETVQVIRYSLGLGPKRRHNMTVSSSRRAQDIVVQRLGANLKQLLPTTPSDFREKIAIRLVEEAKSISGDIVLRAAGPGAYLNELIGMIVAKTETERRYRESNPNAVTAWIYLDDFAHWFERKFPDLLFVAIDEFEVEEHSLIHVEVIETKCVGEMGFNSEATDAQRQVAQGVNRLAQVMVPGNQHLDAFYWYDQFRQAVVGNLDVSQQQYKILADHIEALSDGRFALHINGHSWVVCYDSNVGISGGLEEGDATIQAADLPNIDHFYHHVGRTGLLYYLQFLVEQQWGMDAPEDAWKDDLQNVIVPEHSTTHEYVTETPVEATPMSISEQANDREVPVNAVTSEHQNNVLSEWMSDKAKQLTRSLRDYNVKVYPVDPKDADIGPSIIRLKIQLKPGEKLAQFQKIAPDLQRELELDSVPIVENVSGTRFIGVDLPHPEPDVISQFDFLTRLDNIEGSYIPFLVGITPDGKILSADLKDLKHLLVSGSTGSGKTIFLYSFMVSLLYQFRHQELFFIIIDPKQTDFIFFEDIPHLLGKRVVIEPEEAIEELLNLTENELPARTQQLRNARSRDIQEYNAKFPDNPLAPIVVVIDEYADLVQVLGKKEKDDFETQMVRLAQRARNVGIHLIIATQRPSSDIVTSRLKTNLPARVAFRLPSYHDSMTILDQTGAENLLGRGDMLFKREGTIERLQGFYVETDQLVDFLGRNA